MRPSNQERNLRKRPNARGIQSGERTHTQGQAIKLVSFKPINNTVRV